MLLGPTEPAEHPEPQQEDPCAMTYSEGVRPTSGRRRHPRLAGDENDPESEKTRLFLT